MAKWYMTVGVPGGEFAAKRTCLEAHGWEALRDFFTEALDDVRFRDSDDDCDGSGHYDFYIRPCPPDLVEWIEADEKVGIPQNNSDSIRYKRPGGWQETVFFSNQQNTEMMACATCFIPVAGAAGLTVLNSKETTE